MSYLEELLPEFRKGAKITNRSRDKSFFVQMRKDNGIVNSYGEHYSFDFSDFMSDGWELYQESIDWQYIIDHKCLCLFWNGDDRNKGVIDYLVTVSNESYELYENTVGIRWSKCHPVCKDEVTFYEDKRDD